jgi:HEAT repeat protein
MAFLDHAQLDEKRADSFDGEVFARHLTRFGDSAKQALLQRFRAPHKGLENLATETLGYWPDWTPDDLPVLISAIKDAIYGGDWAAMPLSRIGTPEAIDALISDLPRGEDGSTGLALERLGDHAIPYLFSALQDEAKASSAAAILAQFNPKPLSHVQGWIAIAVDANQESLHRLAALRALAALGPAIQSESGPLHALLSDPQLGKQVVETLRAAGDPVVIPALARKCKVTAAQFDPISIDLLLCLRNVSAFGAQARDAGAELLPLLDSPNSTDQAYAVATLGQIDYSVAIPQIETRLQSPDWRIVNTSIWALALLGDRGALPALDRIASSYWLPPIRLQASKAAATLRSPVGRLILRNYDRSETDDRDDPIQSVTDGPGSGSAPKCFSNRYEYGGKPLKLMPLKDDASVLDFGVAKMAGELVGTNRGEWGGNLAWLPAQGQPQILLRQNVQALLYDPSDSPGAILLSGLAHLGFDFGSVLRVRPDASGALTLTRLARLPGEPTAVSEIKNDLLAVRTANNFVVVLSIRDGIQGLATCAATH